MSHLQQQRLKSSLGNLETIISSPSPRLFVADSNLSSISSANSLQTITSPFELQDIPDESEFQILSTSRFDVSLKMLDKILYLRAGDSQSEYTPMRGYLCINIKKPLRISTIQLQFNGDINVKVFPSHTAPNPRSPAVKTLSFPIFTQSRTWKYKNNDKVLDPDYFAKGSFTYPFQFLIPNNIPESMSNIFGSTNYSLSTTVNLSSSSFAKSLVSQQQYTAELPIQLVQCDTEPEEESLTASDTLSFGNWRHLLCYKIVVSNRQVAIGDSLKFYIKVLPLDPYKYKLKTIKIYLEQVTEYNAESRLSDSEKRTSHKFLVHTDSILIEEIDIAIFDNTVQCWEFDSQIKKNYFKDISGDSNQRKKISLVPTTNAIENRICHFRVDHKVKVIISVEEIEFDDDVLSFESTGAMSTFTTRTRSQSVDKTLFNSRAEKADNAMIKKMSPLIKESAERKHNVDLILKTEVEILKGESTDGKKPPPTYFDAQIERRSDSVFEEVSTKTYSVLDSIKNKPKPKVKPTLNFIVPPAYEEIEEFLEPPPYI